MAMQVNVRLDEAEWEKIVEAMPGLSNGERMATLVRQQLTLLDSRHDLARALELLESTLDPVRQSLRRQRLQGRGSEIAEELAQSVIEMAALLLAQTDALAKSPEKHVPELEAQLARRWSRTAAHVFNAAALDPAQFRNQQGALSEIRRIFAQVSQLAASASTPAAPSSLSSETSTPNQG
jgi:hypothetical protein